MCFSVAQLSLSDLEWPEHPVLLPSQQERGFAKGSAADMPSVDPQVGEDPTAGVVRVWVAKTAQDPKESVLNSPQQLSLGWVYTRRENTLPCVRTTPLHC